MTAAGVGLLVADRVKRAVLGEPVVFADRAELLDVVRHPELYLPFAGTGLFAAGAGALTAGLAALAWLSARAGTRTVTWWQLRQDGAGHHAQARGEAYQGRGPPGRRAADALS